MANTSTHDPLGIIGTTVADKYRIESVAGDGGFSTVYRAEHLIWKQPVAIKFFNILEDAEIKMREGLLEDFVQEGKLMTELSSKSAAIVQARDIGKLSRPDGGWIPYMVLEWLDGMPLDVLLRVEKSKQLPPRGLDEALKLLEPAAAALDIAHRAGVAHRDLKPANVMVMGDARSDDALVKVLDFGIAKVMADREQLQEQLQLTGHQITAFTPTHGAPEQFSRNYGATGPWTDVFAMALMLVETLRSGEQALEGASFFELGVSSCDPNKRPSPHTLGLHVQPQVEEVFLRALAVDPKQRYSTMGEFWADLHRLVFPAAETWRSTQRGQTTSTGNRTGAQVMQPVSIRGEPTTGSGLAGTMPDPAHGKKSNAPLLIGVAVGALLVGGGVFAFTQASKSDAPTPATSATAAAELPTAVPTGEATVEWEGPCPKTMKVVPGGAFTMGSDDESFPLWKPAHEVTLDTFCLAEHEVTVAEYQQCVDEGGCKPADTKPDFPKADGASAEEHAKSLAAFGEFCNYDQPKRQNHPINCVDWYRADAYCAHYGQRLPTEAEWELAARGTDGRKFPWGDDAGGVGYMNAAGTEWKAWLESQDLPAPSGLMYEEDDSYAGTAPVGKYKRGMTQTEQLDMVGNVWEWTNDWYALYADEAQRNPKGPAAGDRKAIRGGGFNGEFSVWINPAARYHQLATASVHVVGFRCAADVREAK